MENKFTKLQKKHGIFLWSFTVILLLLVPMLIFLQFRLMLPGRIQTPQDIDLAHTFSDLIPPLSLVVMATVMILLFFLWRTSNGWWSRGILVLTVFLCFGEVWFARQNFIEWLFAQPRHPEYSFANETDFLSDDDMVMAVEVNGDAVAYPIKQIAYHHIIQDTIGNTPIVATY